MTRRRTFMISSPLPRDQSALESDRAAQIMKAIAAVQPVEWLGWPDPDPAGEPEFADGTGPSVGTPVAGLVPAEAETIHQQVSGAAFWPLLHGRPDLMRYDAAAYRVYLSANRRLAEGLAERLRDEDTVWVHDYLHIPLGQALRERGFGGPLGLLLHAPFPNADQFAAFPRSGELMRQMLRYDLVGFQSGACRANFHHAARRFSGAIPLDGGLRTSGHTVETGVFAIPNDARAIADVAASPAVTRGEVQLRRCSNGCRLIGSWGTLDRAQGLTERFRSFEALLEHRPELVGRVVLVQAISPRRQWIDESDDVRASVESRLSRIEGRFATLDWSPVVYLHRQLSPMRMITLYRAVRVGLITPLCEGVSLTAKDFVASQNAEDPAALVLSRLAGGAEDLHGAVKVNPYNRDAVVAALSEAIAMPLDERRARWRAMMDTLEDQDVKEWSARFITRLQARVRPAPRPRAAPACIRNDHIEDAEPIRVMPDSNGPQVIRKLQL